MPFWNHNSRIVFSISKVPPLSVPLTQVVTLPRSVNRHCPHHISLTSMAMSPMLYKNTRSQYQATYSNSPTQKISCSIGQLAWLYAKVERQGPQASTERVSASCGPQSSEQSTVPQPCSWANRPGQTWVPPVSSQGNPWHIHTSPHAPHCAEGP